MLTCLSAESFIIYEITTNFLGLWSQGPAFFAALLEHSLYTASPPLDDDENDNVQDILHIDVEHIAQSQIYSRHCYKDPYCDKVF